MGWPVCPLIPHLIFDWKSGDGNTAIAPLQPGGTVALVQAGTVTHGLSTPWVDVNGQAITCSRFDLGTLTSGVIGSLNDTDDIVLVSLVNFINASTGVYFYGLVGGPAANPTIAQYTSSSAGDKTYIVGNVTVQPITTTVSNGWRLFVSKIDRNGNSTSYRSGLAGAGLATPTLTATAQMIARLNSGSAGYPTMKIARSMIFMGPSIADIVTSDFATRLSNTVLGIHALNGAQPTFTRESNSIHEKAGVYYQFCHGTPCSGDSDGLSINPAVYQKCYNSAWNVVTPVTTGWAVTGGMTFSIQNDAANLPARIANMGPNTFYLSNTTGATQYLYNGNIIGNTNKHSLSVFARIVAGAPNLGFRNFATGVFTNGMAIAGAYARTENNNLTPVNGTDTFAIEVPNNCSMYLILPQCEEWTYSTDPIANYATAAVAQRVGDQLALPIVDNRKGSVEVELKSKTTNTPVGQAFAWGYHAYIGTSKRLRSYDGTNILEIVADFCTAGWLALKSRWFGATKTLSGQNLANSGAYDSAWTATQQVGASAGLLDFFVRKLLYKRNP
jgi:hypothetical protein